MTELEVLVEPTDQGVRVTPSGAVDAAVDGRLRALLLEAARDGDVELDLRCVPFMDSTGLSVLVTAHAEAARHGHRLRVRGARRDVMRLLVVTELHRDLDVETAQAEPPSEERPEG